jgi:hypothetical protein
MIKNPAKTRLISQTFQITFDSTFLLLKLFLACEIQSFDFSFSPSKEEKISEKSQRLSAFHHLRRFSPCST